MLTISIPVDVQTVVKNRLFACGFIVDPVTSFVPQLAISERVDITPAPCGYCFRDDKELENYIIGMIDGIVHGYDKGFRAGYSHGELRSARIS